MISSTTPHKLAEIIRDTWPQLYRPFEPKPMKTNWAQFFQNLPEDQLEAIALLRVIECTNGCIQHAYREKDDRALSVEQTRAAMNFSMGAMKRLEFTVGGHTYSFSGYVASHLRDARELYIKAFKQNNEEAMGDFFECSIACAKTLGEDRIVAAGGKVKANLADTFPEHTVQWGVNYMINLVRNG